MSGSVPGGRSRFLALLMAGALVLADQIIKLNVMSSLPRVGRTEIVRGLFYLTYVENRGAAFGIFQGQTVILSGITGIVLTAVLVAVVSGRVKGRLLTWSLALVLAGGAGNFIDRVSRGYVVDYLDFSAIFGFPVFNFADCCVVIGTILILCAIVWSDMAEKKTAGELAEPAGTDGES